MKRHKWADIKARAKPETRRRIEAEARRLSVGTVPRPKRLGYRLLPICSYRIYCELQVRSFAHNRIDLQFVRVVLDVGQTHPRTET